MESHTTRIVLTLIALAITTTTTQATKEETIFSANIFDAITQKVTNKNVIISPASIRTALALTYLGAAGNTADELRHGLKLGKTGLTKEEVSLEFKNLLNSMKGNAEATIKMANRIFVNERFSILPKFNDIAQKFFNSSAQSMKFSDNVGSAKTINDWIEKQTENKIRDVVSPGDIGGLTAAVLVNAIYFKAQWLIPFNKQSTSKKDFHITKTSTKAVDMMFGTGHFNYADLKDLDAQALVMTYRGTDLKMLVLLPNQVDGLAQMEKKLKKVVLTDLVTKLNRRHIEVILPKFKFEFEISLQETLEKLGIHDMFTNSADLSELFGHKDIAVSKVIHKAFISVDEYGTEAAAVTAVMAVIISMPHTFKADHPFFFALLDQSVVYFAGQVVDF